MVVEKLKTRINCGVACRPDQGFGVYSAMIRMGDKELPTVEGVIEDGATFIRCSLMAATEGLESLSQQGLTVEVVTPSTHVVDSFNNRERFSKWRDDGWVDDNGDSVVHGDLWARIAACMERHSVEFVLASSVSTSRRQRKRADSNGRGSGPTDRGRQDNDVKEVAKSDGAVRAPDCEISYNVATLGHSGVGAYVITLDYPGRRDEFSSKFQTTSYGRMHLMACLDALESVRNKLRRDGLRIVLNTPDEFTERAVNRGWLDNWSQNKWQRREGDRVRNADLWQVFRRRMLKQHVEVRLVMDSAVSDVLASRAEAIARREHAKMAEDSGFKEQEDADVAAGRTIRIYSDGSALENPGVGGWAAVMEYKGRKMSRCKGYAGTTNNRMELMGPAEALDSLVELVSNNKISSDTKVIVITDSEYLVSAMVRGWAKKWRKNAWKKQNGEKAKNVDLWKRILHANDRLKSVEFRWVRGHSGDADNERCDVLAKKAASQPIESLAVDEGYEGDKDDSVDAGV